MFHRVDYVLLLLALGVGVGFAFAKPLRQAPRAFAWFFAVQAVRAVAAWMLLSVFGWPSPGLAKLLMGAAADLQFVAMASLLGMGAAAALGRDWAALPAESEVLGSERVLGALSAVAAVGWLNSGTAKLIHFEDMTQFFASSGYASTFLRFVSLAEVLGGAALLVRRTALPAIFCLTILMSGAALTHLHNADGVNDNAGAVGQLAALLVLATLHLRRRLSTWAPLRRGAVVMLALGVAVGLASAGAALERRYAPPT